MLEDPWRAGVMTTAVIMASGKRAMLTPQIGISGRDGRTLLGHVDYSPSLDISVVSGDLFEFPNFCVWGCLSL